MSATYTRTIDAQSETADEVMLILADHFRAWNIIVQGYMLAGSTMTFTLSDAVPADQLEHLALVPV